jgi:hypothetical protein
MTGVLEVCVGIGAQQLHHPGPPAGTEEGVGFPTLLSLAGPRVDRPRIRREKHASTAWLAWTRGVIRFRWIAAGSAIAALAIAIIPLFGLQIGSTGADSLATGGPAHDTVKSLQAGGVGNGVLTPMPLLVEPGGDARAFADVARSVDGVRMAIVIPSAASGATAVVVVPDRETVDNSSVTVVTAVRDATRTLPGYGGVTGPGAQVIDFQKAVYDKFPYVIALLALVVFVLLVRAFRSLLLPLKAVVLNLARARPGPHRTPGHLGRADPVLRLRRAGLGATDGHQDPGHRSRSGDPPGRDRRPSAAGAGHGVPVRQVQLVVTGRDRPGPAGAALPTQAGRHTRRSRGSGGD